jgi:hypothetical protein
MRQAIISTYTIASLLLGAVWLTGCNKVKKIDASVARKEKNEQLLKSLGVPINPNLPRIASETEVRLRTPQDVARRAVVLDAVVLVGYRVNTDSVGWLKREGLWDYVSPNEKALFENPTLTAQDLLAAQWRSEALWTLLWAMGDTDELDLPTRLSDAETAERVLPIPGESCAKFINQAKLRPEPELLDAADLIYRIDWAVVDAHLKKTPPPGGFISDIVTQRHYALNWLVRTAENWDDVTTDT